MEQSNRPTKNNQPLVNWRSTVVGLLGCIAFLFLMAEPAEDATNWTLSLLGSQGIGYACGALSVFLFNRWEKKGYFPK